MSLATDNREFVILGRISGLYGVKGWLKIFSYTDPRENILNYRDWYVRKESNEPWRLVTLHNGKAQGKGIIAQLIDIDDRDRAAELLGAEIAIPRDLLPETSADEYYWAELIGLRVLTVSGDDLGRVDHLIETGANDVLVVQGDRERLIPYIPGQVIVDIDLAQGIIHVDWDPEF